jgi:DivIVA domain-containing protein
MEISAKVLREVEFRDRLRGYDTDEVDEFLEEVAVAVEELQRRLEEMPVPVAAAPVVPAVVERSGEPSLDEDSIRRTLVLAQRTADLAIKEANEEATQLLEDARRKAHELVGQATESARKMREEADAEFASRVNVQLSQREELEQDVYSLSKMVSEERSRLTDALQSLLRYVGENLTVAGSVVEHATTHAIEAGIEVPEPSLLESPDPEPYQIEAPVEEHAEANANADDILPPIDEDLDPITVTTQIPVVTPEADPAPADKDEELWQRWASGGGFDEEETADGDDPFGFNRRP